MLAIAALLERHQLQRPDARPLFAYRLTDTELAEFIAKTRAASAADPTIGPVFCLVAAEIWRRNYDGGLWTWDTILTQLGWPSIEHMQLQTLVTRGLAYWKRDVLQLARREFLGSVAREAGIPTLVLQTSGTRIRAFLQDLLADLRTFGTARALEHARRSSTCLPERLRNATFLTIATDLALAALELAAQLGTTTATVASLDRAAPNWRLRLPLVIDDEAALALVTGLVDEARVPPTPRPMRVNTYLVETPRGQTLRRELHLPAAIEAATLAELMGVSPASLPPMSDLLCETTSGPRLVALLSQRAGGKLVIEPLNGPGPDADPDRDVVLSVRAQGRILGHFVPPGGQALSALPWIFATVPSAPASHRLVAQGSTRFDDHVRVLAPTTFRPLSEAESVATVAGRALYLVTNDTIFTDGSHQVALRRGAPPSDEVYLWDGRRLPEQRDVFIGRPTLWRVLPTGERRDVPFSALEAQLGHTWRPLARDPVGRFAVRLRDDSGLVLFTDRIDVLPADARLDLQPLPDGRGRVVITMTPEPLLGIVSSPDIIDAPPSDGPTRDLALTDRTTTFDIELRWPTTSLRLSLPFPRRGARFVTSSGDLLGGDASIALDDLHTAVAEAWAYPQTQQRVFALEATLHAQDCAVAPLFIGYLEPMSHVRHALPLHALARQLARLVAVSASPSASVSLRILDQAGFPKGAPTLRIGRFSAELTISPDKSMVTGPSDLTFEALRFTDPDTVIALPPQSPGTASLAPLLAHPGAWMIFGRRGPTIVAPPKLRQVASLTETSSSPLREAMDLRLYSERQAAFKHVFEAIADVADDPDWQLVGRLFELLDRFPLTTFESLRSLASVPSALVRALARSERPVEIVRAFESMPFHWATLPVEAIERALRTELAAVEAIWANVSQVPNLTRASLVTATFQPAHDALAARYLGTTLLFTAAAEAMPELAGAYPNAEIGLARAAPEFFLGELEDALNALRQRHLAPDWPRLDGLSDLMNATPLPPSWAAITRAHLDDVDAVRLVEAPLVAALCAVRRPYQPPTAIEAFALRLAESFDPDYFMTTHARALALALADRPRPLA